ncbi:hypothetical protein Pmani_009951 [Petrolisthes manimaculis]|uniref:Uncharacterized protein n=1 Tax=Petrolisthes manimaculis TaxID=1843537 RepID=A0AAE1Q2H4_9EUCA|nr:hypothetical protein Pmani_009951 [Petrolisthes manimaculis]
MQVRDLFTTETSVGAMSHRVRECHNASWRHLYYPPQMCSTLHIYTSSCEIPGPLEELHEAFILLVLSGGR